MEFDKFSLPDGFFLRSIKRKSHWEPESGEVSDVIKAVFPFSAEDKYSLYWVNSDTSLKAVIGGLSLNRENLQNMDLICFTPQELRAANITFLDTAGETSCRFANRQHVDIIADQSQLCALCGEAKSNERKATRVSKKTVLKPLVKFLREEVHCGHEKCVWCENLPPTDLPTDLGCL